MVRQDEHYPFPKQDRSVLGEIATFTPGRLLPRLHRVNHLHTFPFMASRLFDINSVEEIITMRPAITCCTVL